MEKTVRTSDDSQPALRGPALGATWRRSTLIVRDGLEIAVREAGLTDPAAPALVLVHGLGHWTEAAWDAVAARLEDSHRILAFDLPGFGDSGKPDVRYELGFFVETLRAVVAAKQLGPYHIVGHSLGGLIAALHAPGTTAVERLTLIDPAGFLRTPGLLLRIVASKPVSSLFRLRPTRGFVKSQLERSVYDRNAITDALVDRAHGLALDPAMRRAFARVYSDALREFVDLPALHARLAAFRGPVRILWGREDRYVPIAGLEHARAVYPQAEVTVLERCGHCPNIEYPAFTAEAIAATSHPS
jgi:pimeloyl-ACP methyl ester carboxylesterase